MSLVPSTRRPGSHRVSLPWDCLVLVFKECDPATLAILGRVSLDVLTVTAPLLYHDVDIGSFTTLELLFCERTTVQSLEASRVNAHLSLEQVQTLRLKLWSYISPSIALSLSRLHSGSLPLRKLEIVLIWGSPDNIGTISETLYECLLPLLRPTHVSWHVRARDDRAYLFFPLVKPSFDQYQLRVLPWGDVESVELMGRIPYGSGPERTGILGIPRPTSTSDRTFRLHLATLVGEGYPTSASLLGMLGSEAGSPHLGLETLQPGSVTLVVTSDAARIEAENAIQTQVLDRYKPIFVVEVET